MTAFKYSVVVQDTHLVDVFDHHNEHVCSFDDTSYTPGGPNCGERAPRSTAELERLAHITARALEADAEFREVYANAKT